jgi:DNA-binding winged helix-turn-helix (wHTH) protein
VRLRFRDCVLDTGVRALLRDGTAVALSPKAFSLLEILVEQRPNAVSHADLREKLWPDTAMGGTTLARLISEVRAALGDRDEQHPVVRTVHRFGYAFSVAVTEDHVTPPRLPGCAIRWGSQLVPLASGENVIGRSADGLISLPSTKVSRRHARIVVANGRVILEDLGSRHGTYLGDRRIESAVELKNGDRIGIGPAQLIFCAAADDALTSMQSTPSR